MDLFIDSVLLILFWQLADMGRPTSQPQVRTAVLETELHWLLELDYVTLIWNSFNSIRLESMVLDA